MINGGEILTTFWVYCCVCWTYEQVNNLPVNILPVAYNNQSHGQSSYSSLDLPRDVVMSLSQGSTVKSLDFHPSQQILLLGLHQLL